MLSVCVCLGFCMYALSHMRNGVVDGSHKQRTQTLACTFAEKKNAHTHTHTRAALR